MSISGRFPYLVHDGMVGTLIASNQSLAFARMLQVLYKVNGNV